MSAQCQPAFESRLTVAGAGGLDALGASVGLHGDLAAVGSSEVDLAGTNAGAVHLFRRAGGSWAFETTLLADDAGARDAFGAVVALGPERVVVGAPRDDDAGTDSGTVYVFERSAGVWTISAKLRDGQAGDKFGGGLVLVGDRLIVGAPSEATPAGRSGAVHVYEYAGGVWSSVPRLLAADGLADDAFGSGLALRGDRLLIGAAGRDETSLNSGAAYVFELQVGSWTQVAKLLAPDGASDDFFGGSAALSSDRALVGAVHDATPGFAQGSAHVFVRTALGWSHEQKLTASDGAPADHFGISVGFVGEEVWVGADLASNAVLRDAGALYRFSRSGGAWSETGKLASPEADGLTQFAGRIALDGQRLVAGAPNLDVPTLNSGGAYIVDLCAWEDLGGALAGSGGPPRLAGTGQLVPGSVASFLLAGARADTPLWHALALGSPGARPFFGGVLQAFPVVHAVVARTDLAGENTLQLAVPTGTSGAVVILQSALRDPGAPRGFALSNAVRARVP